MTEIFSTIRLIAVLVVVLLLGFGVLLALPHSRLKEIVQPFVGWAIAALSVAYIVSPLDVLPEMVLGPFGLVDDLAALAVAIASAVAAMNTGKGSKQLR